MVKNLLLLLTAILCLGACTKSTPTQAILVPADTTGTPVELDSFPLQVGHSWTYMVQAQTQMPASTPGTPATYTATRTMTYTLTIVSDTVLNGIQVFGFTCSLDTSFGAFYSFPLGNYNSRRSYFASVINANYLTGGIYVLQAVNQAYQGYITDSAYLLAKYPVNIGDTWSSPVNSVSHNYNCTWESYRQITVPAGTFSCAKLMGTANAYLTNQFYSAKGLVMKYESANPGAAGTTATKDAYVRLTTLMAVNF